MKKRQIERKRLENLKVITWYRTNKGNNVIHLQNGNSKLVPDDHIGFLIFSLPAVITCPGATANCMHYCYARRDERFTSIRQSRLDNLTASKSETFVSDMIAAINNAIYTKSGDLRKAYKGKKIVFRLHESGDFYNVAYMEKWFEIAKHFSFIQFFTYTKSFAMLEKCIDKKPYNFFIRGSVWDDTNDKEKEIIDRLNMVTYTAQNEVANIPKKNICDCAGGCAGCGCKCGFLNENIVTKIH